MRLALMLALLGACRCGAEEPDRDQVRVLDVSEAAQADPRPPSPPASASPPNLILVTIDTLRADRIGAYGYLGARTPRIDQLAEEGTRFARALTPTPRTTPGLASLLTGLYPHHHGSREVFEPAPHGTSLAETLRAHGYQTLAVSANAAASPQQGLDRGFDEFRVRFRGDASTVNEALLTLERRTDVSQPIFAWAHYVDPHWPYHPPDDASPRTAAACRALEALDGADVVANVNGVAHAALVDCQRAYDDEVAWADRQFGELLEALEARGRLANAVVVLTSDHGEGFGERGLYYDHGPNLHPSQTDIPLIVWGTGVVRDQVVRHPVSLIDLAPTLFELFGLEGDPPRSDGSSLAARLRGEDPRDRSPRFLESANQLIRRSQSTLLSGRPRTGYCLNRAPHRLCWDAGGEPTLFENGEPMARSDRDYRAVLATMTAARERWSPGSAHERAVVSGEFRLVQRPRFEGGHERTLHRGESDADVSGAHPNVVARLERALDEWQATIPPYEPGVVDAETEARLRALGYVE